MHYCWRPECALLTEVDENGERTSERRWTCAEKLLLCCAERHSRHVHKSFMISKSQCLRADVMSHEYPFILFLKASLKFNPRNKTKGWDTVQLLSSRLVCERPKLQLPVPPKETRRNSPWERLIIISFSLNLWYKQKGKKFKENRKPSSYTLTLLKKNVLQIVSAFGNIIHEQNKARVWDRSSNHCFLIDSCG